MQIAHHLGCALCLAKNSKKPYRQMDAGRWLEAVNSELDSELCLWWLPKSIRQCPPLTGQTKNVFIKTLTTNAVRFCEDAKKLVAD